MAAHLLKPYNKLAQNPTYDLRLSWKKCRVDFGKIRLLKIPPPTPQAVSLLKQHSLFAHYTPIAASSEGSRHASAPAHFESWGVDD